MKNLHAAALAALLGFSATAGLIASTTTTASADQGERGTGGGKHHRNNNGNWQNGQNAPCNNNGNTRRDENDGDEDNQGQDEDKQDNRGASRGQKRGWQNPNNPHFNCNPNGQNGQNGNQTLRGTITQVNGNQVTLMAGFGNFVTINDQPALDNQQSGRVVVGRYVTAYGYYQNGIFYATSMQ